MMEKYLKDISSIPLVTPAREMEIAKKAATGCKESRDLLIMHNLRYVIDVAKSYQGQGLSLEDLIAEGNLGICKAADRFDPERGMKFITYAVWWIKQAILQALSENTRLVRIPTNKINTIQKLRKKSTSSQDDLDDAGITPEVLEMYTNFPVRLDNNNNKDQPILEIFEDTASDRPDKQLTEDSLRIDLEDLLKNLSEREAEILRYYHGIDEFRSFTLEEIGNILGLTRERIRQIKKKSLRKIRRNPEHRDLKKYL